VDRLVQTADFQRVLQQRGRWHAPHFALHHVATGPARRKKPLTSELSTGQAPTGGEPVDDLPDRIWLGAVVPKRHARRAVTRSLLKRQIRAAVERHAARLAPGLWVVRLRAPFDRSQFPSAASDALRALARQELDGLLARAAG
jgi:ribonuclease P protein component